MLFIFTTTKSKSKALLTLQRKWKVVKRIKKKKEKKEEAMEQNSSEKLQS